MPDILKKCHIMSFLRPSEIQQVDLFTLPTFVHVRYSISIIKTSSNLDNEVDI